MAVENLVIDTSTGETQTGAAPGDGSGGSAYVVDVGMADSQVGTDFKTVAVVSLPAGTIIASSSMAWIGVDDNTNNAELEIRDANDGTLLATITKTGLVGAAAPSANLTVTAGEYSIRLRAATAGVTAFCFGLHLSYVGGIPTTVHASETNTQALWQFNGNLTATTGNNLTVSTGTARYGPAAVASDLALSSDGGLRLSQTRDANLAITGALTVQFLVRPHAVPTGYVVICAFTSTGAAQADNTLYQVRLAADNVLSYSHQHGTKVNDIWDTTGIIIPTGEWTHIALTRAANGLDLEFFVNGISRATTSLSNAPDGGTNSTIFVANFATGSFSPNADISSLRIDDAVATDAAILADARKTLPPYLRS